MCCGRDDAPTVSENGNRLAKMPDGTVVEVTSKAEERAKKQEVYASMRNTARSGWSAVQS
jgi:hypothetical protein